ncbi:MAG: toprim domain-containing protein [Nanoarchaeota archaeon]|nr:toprim domain-containing protein [Nanoarchaeota archaeon]
MKFNHRLKQDIERYKDYVILVEGQNDMLVLKDHGFEKVYAIHKNSVSLRERIEQLAPLIDKKEKVCILTDLDKRGKKLYGIIKPILQELGIQTDSGFRGLLIKSKITHIEGLTKFFERVESITKESNTETGHRKKARSHYSRTW